MTTFSSLCDAADWFDPELGRIITDDLREPPRFHRKQWEFAVILRTLRRLGMLDPARSGLSMGGGRERILYVIAPLVRHLLVTDLYEQETSWECARTGDPAEFLRANKPFPVDDACLSALHMDMRQLEFPDRSFDFCYSTCAVEHIGGWEDFRAHFREVERVLADGGVYVFTTEVSYDGTTIRDDHNYVFALDDLREVLADTALAPDPVFDARITEHVINRPFPSAPGTFLHAARPYLAARLLESAPHIQLMRGKHPFTCGVFVLRKGTGSGVRVRQEVIGLPSARRFMEEGVSQYQSMVESSGLLLDPFSGLPAGARPLPADHAEFRARPVAPGPDTETLFHTDYVWLGNGRRSVGVVLDLGDSGESCSLEIRIHRFATLNSTNVECAGSARYSALGQGRRTFSMEFAAEEACQYAVLARVTEGSCLCARAEVRCFPAAAGEMPEIAQTGAATWTS